MKRQKRWFCEKVSKECEEDDSKMYTIYVDAYYIAIVEYQENEQWLYDVEVWFYPSKHKEYDDMFIKIKIPPQMNEEATIFNDLQTAKKAAIDAIKLHIKKIKSQLEKIEKDLGAISVD